MASSAIRALVLVAAALAALSGTAAAAGFSPPPTPNHYVVDTASALDDATTTAIEAELRAFEKGTGHQVVVYIGQTTGDVPLESYTAQTAHAWRIGRKGKDDGAILFLFMQDRKVRIEVGYGLEGSLTDAAAEGIIRDEIVPRMRSGDVNAAVTAGVAKMLAAIDPTFALTVTAAPRGTVIASGKAGAVFIFVFVALFCLPWIFIIWRIVVAARRGELITGKGSSSGGSSFAGSFGSSSGDDDSSSDDDFDAGGGDFGGGGASGSW
jgi:uncharacterized protein